MRLWRLVALVAAMVAASSIFFCFAVYIRVSSRSSTVSAMSVGEGLFGAVEFSVWGLIDGERILRIIGPDDEEAFEYRWRRPVVSEPLGVRLVRPEKRFGDVELSVSDYLARVFGDLSDYIPDHSAHAPVPYREPFGDAPQILKYKPHGL